MDESNDGGLAWTERALRRLAHDVRAERGGQGGRLSSRAVEHIGCVILPED